MKRVFEALFACLLLTSVVSGKTYNFTNGFDKDVPPVLTDNGEFYDAESSTVVEVSMHITKITHVNEDSAEITMDVFLHLYWTETRLVLPDSVNSSSLPLRVNKEEISQFWVPDLFIVQLRQIKNREIFHELKDFKIFGNRTIRYVVAATITIECTMEFILYPLDIQTCPLDLTSFSYGGDIVKFQWHNDDALTYPDTALRLSSFNVQFLTNEEPVAVPGVMGDHTAARMFIILKRELRSHMLDTYIPSALFVLISWCSFLVPPEAVPGRMVLLVTTLLTLVTMFNSLRANTPDALGLKCNEVWVVSCILFVFFAFIEYGFLLFIMRFHPSWRSNRVAHVGLSDPQNTAFIPLSDLRHRKSSAAPETQLQNDEDLDGEVPVEHLENRRKAKRMRLKNLFRMWQRLKSGPDYLDQLCLFLFPGAYVAFNLVYWVCYGTQRMQRFNL